jgi:hypothetical protein
MDTENRWKLIYWLDKKAVEQACAALNLRIKLPSRPLTFCQVLREAAHFSNRGQTTHFTLTQESPTPH